MQSMNALAVPIYVLPGNRDSRAVMLEYFRDSDYLPRDAEFFQYSIEHYDTRFIVLDTHSPDTNKGELCDQRLADFERLLNTDSHKPVVVIMHHPPFEVSEIPDPIQFADWSQVEKFRAIVSQHAPITQIICGHVHRTIDATLGTVPVRALTCLAGDLRKGEVTDEERMQPVYRWHQF